MDIDKRKGVHVSAGENVLDALKKKVPHWIHVEIKDPTYVGGVKISRECECSACGYHASHEYQICPHCHVKMDQLK